MKHMEQEGWSPVRNSGGGEKGFIFKGLLKCQLIGVSGAVKPFPHFTAPLLHKVLRYAKLLSH